IAVDSAGNSYVTGSYTGTVNFGAGEANQTLHISAGASDIFINKYNSDGSLAWAKTAGSPVGGILNGADQGNGIAVDSFGNSYVTGFYNGPAIFGLGEPHQTGLGTAIFTTIFVAKYNSDGTLAWAKGINGGAGAGSNQGSTVTTDTSGNGYVAGYFQTTNNGIVGLITPQFSDGTTQTTLISAGSTDIFVAKYAGDTDNDGVSNLRDNCP